MRKSAFLRLSCFFALFLGGTLFAQAQVAPVFTGPPGQTLTICENSAAASINAFLEVNDADNGETLTWTVSSGPANGTLNGFSTSETSNSGNVTPSGLTYTPDNGYDGSDAFTIQISDGTFSALIMINVTVNPLPTVTAPGDYAICAGQSTTLTGSGNADTYTWDNSVTDGVSFTPGGTQTYTVTGTITATGCQSTDAAMVTVNPLPTVTAPADYAVCAGQSTTLTGSGTADTYTWDNGVTDGVSFTPGGTQTYTVTGTITATGCQNTDQVVVNVNPLPTVNIPSNYAICAGQSTILNAIGTGNTYTWDNSVTNSVSFTPAGTLTYTATGTITATGCQNTAQVTVTVNPLPTVTAPGDYAVCSGQSTTLSGSGTADTYTWNHSVTNGVSFTPGGTLTYTVTGTVTATGCQNTDQVVVVVNPLPTVNIPSNYAICAGQSTTLTATGNANTYTWNNGVTNGISFSPAGTLTYTATGTITATGCQNTAQVIVTVNPLPTVGAGSDQSVCYNDLVTLNGSGAVSYSWNNGVTNNTAFNALATTTYTVTGTDGNGCQNTDQVLVTVNALQPAAYTVSTSTVYAGQTGVTYTVPLDPLVDFYTWTYSGTGETINGSGNSVTVDFNTSATSGNLRVFAHTNSPSCTSPARTIAITVADPMPWTGTTSSDWNDGSNWAGGFVPYSTINVIIHSSAPNQPVIASGTPVVRNLTVGSSAVLTIDPGASLSVLRTLALNGSVEGDYLTLNGPSAQSISGSGYIDNLELDNGNGAIITSGNVHIVETYKPTDGVLTTNAHLTLVSDAGGTASVMAPPVCSGNYISGDVNMEKYIHGGRRCFRFIAHPFADSKPMSVLTDDIDITGNGGATNGFTTTGTNNPSSFWYDSWTGSNDTINDITGWIAFNHTNGFGSTSWDRGEGIRIMIRGQKGQGLDGLPYTPNPVTLTIPGDLNQCDVTLACRKNANIGVTGFNLLGNPYASNVDLIQTSRGDSISDNFWVWDPNQGLYGAYIAGSFSLLPSYILPAYSSFFVHNDGDTTTPDNKVTFHETDKVQTASDDNLFKTTAGLGQNAVQLRIVSNNDAISWDRLLIFFNGQSSAQWEDRDARKFVNPSLDFYTLSADTAKLAIDVRPLVQNEIIPLGLRADSQFQYSIRVDDYDVPGAQLYLIDKFLNQSQPLTAGMHYDFNVTGNPLSQGNNRFAIGVTTTGIGQLAGKDMNMSLVPNPAEQTVVVSFDALKRGQTEVHIRNLMGQQVFRANMGMVQSGDLRIPVAELASGVYMVTINCGDQVITQRLIKK